MGTRSLTAFVDEDKKEIVVMYRQYDGNPSGHGLELAEFLAGIKLVSGLAGEGCKDRVANGIACLSAQVVGHFKAPGKCTQGAAGNFYLHPAGTRDVGEQYMYFVREKRVPKRVEGQPREIEIEARGVTFRRFKDKLGVTQYERNQLGKLLYRGDAKGFIAKFAVKAPVAAVPA
jgi:hypothetical protein